MDWLPDRLSCRQPALLVPALAAAGGGGGGGERGGPDGLIPVAGGVEQLSDRRCRFVSGPVGKSEMGGCGFGHKSRWD